MSRVVTTISIDPIVREDARILAQINGHKSFSDLVNALLEEACNVERYRIDETRKLQKIYKPVGEAKSGV